MKFSFVGLLALVAAANAQYLSDGWSPGKAVPTNTPSPAAPFEPAPPSPPSETNVGDTVPAPTPSTFLEKVLLSEPLRGVLEKAGVNISERLSAAQARAKFWDERVPMITDENYGDLIVNETLSLEEEKERVWFLVITVTSAKEDGISKLTDTAFDEAFNQTVVANDLQHVKWGRIDYLNVTALTTRWNVWQAPYLVLISSRGQTLRFLKPTQLRLKPELIRDFLQTSAWESIPPWQSSYAPGGSNEYIIAYLGDAMKWLYGWLTVLPKWALYIVTGGFASVAMNLLHRGEAKKAALAASASASTEKKRAGGSQAILPVQPKVPASPAKKAAGDKGKKRAKK